LDWALQVWERGVDLLPQNTEDIGKGFEKGDRLVGKISPLEKGYI